ncbi:MAG: efflux RND transporter permease subunit [Pseudomonadota bacterium]|nr:efflux RND transporter permease subunit [Pseudomonadota bacterium]
MLESILSRPKTVLTLMVVMIVAGIATYLSIPKEAQPDIDVPIYYVSISQQGISPGDSERLLVRPMETQLRGLEGLKELTGVASEGHAGILLEFTIESDKDQVLADIRDKVDQGKADLPDEADEPEIFETNFALQPTIIVTLSGNIPERTLYAQARRLKDEIEAISTVREAELKGNREELLEVILDLEKLESYDITQTELLNALSQYNQLVPAGFLDDGEARFNLKLPGLVENAADVYSIPIKQNAEGVVTLGQVAEIRRGFKDASTYTRVNGETAVSLEVVKRLGTNIIENNEEVRRVVNEFSKNWDGTIKVNFLIDQSSYIFDQLGSLQSSIMTAIALVMIVVVAALGLRSGLLVGLAIPTSFMVGFLILGSLGMTVNMMVMYGLVLCVGMLVDGAIVMTEYADRKLSEGLEAEEAYKRAARLMLWPIISSTATTLAAFLPLLLWPGVIGEFMSYLPIMVIIVLTASLLTALVFVPVTGIAFAQYGALVARYPRLFQALHAFIVVTLVAWLAEAGGMLAPGLPAILHLLIAVGLGLCAALVAWFVTSLVLRYRRDHPAESRAVAAMLSSEAELDPTKLTGPMGVYVRFLDLVTRSVAGNFVVILAAIAITVGTFIAFGSNNNGVEFFVEEEPDLATIFVSARGNLSGRDIRDLAIEVEQEVLKVKGLDNVVMTATAPGGQRSGGLDLGGSQDKPGDAVATFQVELAEFNQRRKASEIFQEIRDRTAGIAGIRVEVRKQEEGPPQGKDIQLEVKSDNYDTMVGTVAHLRDYFDSLADIQDIEDGLPLPGIEWEIDLNRQEAGRYNAGVAEVGAMVQLVTNGLLMGKYRPNDSEDELDIRIRLPKEDRTLQKLDELRLRTSNGQVPISNFVEVRPQQKVTSITRKDGSYAMDIKANLVEGARFGDRDLTPTDKVAEIQAYLDSNRWPDGIRFRFRGSDEEQKESGEFLGKASLGALFLMFIILVTQFNSFYQTFLTLMTVVLAMVGVLVGMMVTGQKFSIVMTGTGIVALAGIVVNNAIVLIDTYNRLRSEGVDLHAAVLKTSAQRFRPIFLTTFTTILGLVPMALSINLNFIEQVISISSLTAIWWVQLSTAIIFGLAFSTLLTLILTPVMLSLPTNLARAWRVWWLLDDDIRRASNGETANATDVDGEEPGPERHRPTRRRPKDLPPESMPQAAE